MTRPPAPASRRRDRGSDRLGGLCAARRGAGQIPLAHGRDRRAVRGRRRHRHPGAAPHRWAHAAAGADLRGDQPPRRQHQSRHRQLVAQAKPDGYTLLMTSFGLAANPSLYRNLGFDPANDLDADLAACQRADHPGGASVVSGQHAGGIHRPCESQSRQVQLRLLRRRLEPAYRRPSCSSSMTGTDVVHVPFNGGGPAAIAVAGKQVEMLFPSAAAGARARSATAASSRSRSPPTSARRSCPSCRPSGKAASTTSPAAGSAC